MDMALEAFTAGVYFVTCKVLMESFAALLMFRGVVVSSETCPRITNACFILSSYSISFFLRTTQTLRRSAGAWLDYTNLY